MILKLKIENDKTLNDLSLNEYKSFENIFENDIYEEIKIENCVNKRNVVGGPAKEQVSKRIDEVEKIIKMI